MSTKNYNCKTKNGFMLFSLVIVVILSFSVSVVLYLFLAKNGLNNREFFKTKFDENEVNDELTKIKNMKSDIERVSKSMETKSMELEEIKIEKNKLVEKLEIAKKVADKRKVDQKILSITTPAGELPSNPVIAKTEIKQLVETINDNLKKIADAKQFDEKLLKNSAIGLNDELRKFLENKEKEALNNPDFKAKYGREWVATVNDLKNKGKKSVYVQLELSQISESPNAKGVVGLKTLLSQTKVEELNYYFAFDYFPQYLEKMSLEALKEIVDKATPDAVLESLTKKDKEEGPFNTKFKKNNNLIEIRNKGITNDANKYLNDIKKYKEFLKNLDTDNK
jgi:hypothetical protein